MAGLLSVALLASAGEAAKNAAVEVPVAPSATGAPEGWKVKEWKGKASFEVVDAPFGKAIRMRSQSTSSALYKELSVDLKETPYLSWSWKVTELPRGGDVRKRKADDQAAQVYVVFPRWPSSVNSRLVGYIWDSSAPEGFKTQSTKNSNTRYIVLKSGGAGLGEWHRETRNVYQDYRLLFNEEPSKAGSLSVMIDSDDTRSSAEALVGNFAFSAQPANR